MWICVFCKSELLSDSDKVFAFLDLEAQTLTAAECVLSSVRAM